MLDGSSLLLAAGVAAGATALLTATMWFGSLVSLADGEQAPPTVWRWLGPLLALGLGLAAVGLMRWSLAERRWQDERRQARRLVDLLDVWFWQTETQHRVTVLRPPLGAGERSWEEAAQVGAAEVGSLLWEVFSFDAPTTLTARLNAQAPVVDMPVAWVRRGAGTSRWMLRGVPRFDARGRFLGYEGTLRPLGAEVAEPAPAEEPTAETATAAEEAPRDAEAADQEAFAYAVSHDLRAPLRVVEGFTRIVQEDYGRVLDRLGNDHLERVLGAASRMNNMIDALLDQAKLSTQPLAREPVNLSQLATFVVDDLRRQGPEHAAEIEIEEGLVEPGDPLLLRLVLENLLGNAWKYSAKRECSRISLRRVVVPAQPGRQAYCVADNGVGFDMRYADKLFGLFQRLHSASEYQGTGVGLASVRRIVHRHGGDIWAESEVDKGTRFYFTLNERSDRC